MELTVLGRYGRYAPPNGAGVGYLIREKGAKILVECGPGALARLQSEASVSEIDAIILSHLHFDHISDIFSLDYMIALKKLSKIPLYLPKTPHGVAGLLKECGSFDLRYIKEGIHSIGAVNVDFFAVKHSAECYAFKIITDNGVFVYTADCAVTDGIARELSFADTVLGDACVLHSNLWEQSPHLSVKQLASASAKTKLLLTHLSAGDESEILSEALRENENAVLCEEMKTYRI